MLKSQDIIYWKITIITVTLNQCNDLEKTIQNIGSIRREGVAFHIIDGKSTDGTIEMIQKYRDLIDSFISEPDKGIYDAMNKGWNIAANDSLILYLGAGDTIEYLPKIEKKENRHLVVFGKVKLSNGTVFHSKVGFKTKFFNTLHHQGLLISKSITEKSPFNLSFKIYADFDFNQRILKQNVPFLQVSDFVTCMAPEGASRKLFVKEWLTIVKRNFGFFYCLLAIIFFVKHLKEKGFGSISLK